MRTLTLALLLFVTVQATGLVRASYYANRFAGRLTANGERYNPNAFTAAHMKLPFGTGVRVTNVKTGVSVLVRVNDRGPYVKGREIDLSLAAAKQIGITQQGVAEIKYQILGKFNEAEFEQLRLHSDMAGETDGNLVNTRRPRDPASYQRGRGTASQSDATCTR